MSLSVPQECQPLVSVQMSRRSPCGICSTPRAEGPGDELASQPPAPGPSGCPAQGGHPAGTLLGRGSPDASPLPASLTIARGTGESLRAERPLGTPGGPCIAGPMPCVAWKAGSHRGKGDSSTRTW